MSAPSPIDRAALLLGARAGRVAALTGAGISAPSGIPDFRSPGGIWDRYPPEQFATIEAFRADPVRVWPFLRELDDTIAGAEPNPAHTALAQLEQAGVLVGVVTQNVDGLHQRAGSRVVIEYHGSADRLACLACGNLRPAAEGRGGEGPPRCPRCGAIEKPDVVMFGEVIPEQAVAGAQLLVERCDLWLVVGTSAQVYPAAAIPLAARARGATVVELNLEPCLDGADVRIFGDVVRTLPALVERLGGLSG